MDGFFSVQIPRLKASAAFKMRKVSDLKKQHKKRPGSSMDGIHKTFERNRGGRFWSDFLSDEIVASRKCRKSKVTKLKTA